ncbi:MAG: zinc ABC transporter substrate-binding protein [Planctomycetota bacterium]
MNRRAHRLTSLGRALLAAAAIALSATLTACGGAGSGGETGPATLTAPYRAVTTCTMVTDIVREIAGEYAEVEGLMGPGVDPHLYKPNRDDLATLAEADVIFYSGLMLEGRMADSFAKMSRSRIPCYAVTELLDPEFLLEPEEFEGHWDPHVWNDVAAWIGAVDAVAAALSDLDPAHADDYAANAERYTAELNKLDAYAKACIATIPEKSRVLITAHDAFNYFARAYGIRVMAAQGVTTESEAAISDIEQLVDFVVENDIRSIFVENIASDRNLQAVVEGAGARGHELRIGGELFSDATGPAGTYEGTYLGMVDHNVTLITRELGGEAPEAGLNGRLGGPESAD